MPHSRSECGPCVPRISRVAWPGPMPGLKSAQTTCHHSRLERPAPPAFTSATAPAASRSSEKPGRRPASSRLGSVYVDSVFGSINGGSFRLERRCLAARYRAYASITSTGASIRIFGV